MSNGQVAICRTWMMRNMTKYLDIIRTQVFLIFQMRERVIAAPKKIISILKYHDEKLLVNSYLCDLQLCNLF